MKHYEVRHVEIIMAGMATRFRKNTSSGPLYVLQDFLVDNGFGE